MKTLNLYIIEKLHLDKKIKIEASYEPTSKEELIDAVKEVIANAKKKRDIDFNCIDTSKVNDMSSIFSTVCKDLNIKIYKINVSSWDTSNVTTMKNMFSGCKYLETDVSSWDVGNVTDMTGMFMGCERFEGKGIENWNISKVERFIGTFAGCENLDCNLSSWDVSNFTPTNKKWMLSRVPLKKESFPKGY